MKVTRRQLRRSIRKMLLENISYEEKIIELFSTGDADIITQAIELASTIGLITVTKEKALPDGNPLATYVWEFKSSTDSFAAALAIMAPDLSKGFYQGTSDVSISYYNTGDFTVMVNQK